MTHIDFHSGPVEAAPARRRIAPAIWIPTAGLLAVSLVLGVSAMTYRPTAAASPAHAAPALTVTTAAPRQALWPTSLQAPGAIAAWQEASIGTQIGGYQLIEVRVNVGDRVRKGQVLARLNPALLEAEEAQLKATNDQAQANLRRVRSLQGSGAISDQDVLQYETAAKTAHAALAAKRLQLRYTEVRAPGDGTISARPATLGAVTPVGQELFRVILNDRLEWRGELTASQLSHIARGQTVSLRLPDGGAATARVREAAPSLGASSRLGLAYADIAPGSSARAGMYADGQVVLGQSTAQVVPAESVVIRDGRSYVLKLAGGAPTARVALQAVAMGRRRGGEVEIMSGLGAADRVVVEGAGFLNDGDVVRLANRGGAPNGTAGR
jgi:RND family efflux transporter MFP subunit